MQLTHQEKVKKARALIKNKELKAGVSIFKSGAWKAQKRRKTVEVENRESRQRLASLNAHIRKANHVESH